MFISSRSINKMKLLSRRNNVSGSLAVILASSQVALSYLPTTHHAILATAFSFNVQQSRATTSPTSSTKRHMSKMDQSFKTWSYDSPCTTMAWNEMSSATLTVTDKTNDWDEQADLVLVGVFAPKKEENGNDESEDEEEPTVSLEGAAKDLDEKLGGALSDLMLENAKTFKHGADAGSVTPTLRLQRWQGSAIYCYGNGHCP